MARCRAQYFKEIDIVEHIMQFREVKAEQESNVNKDEKKAERRSLLIKRARTKILDGDGFV